MMRPKYLKNLPRSLKNSVNKCPLIIGIGPSAWPRIISSYYFPKFKILCYSDCQDNELIREAGQEVYSLRQIDPYLEVVPITPGKIIETDLAKKFLKGQSEPFTFLVYKTYPLFERLCEESGWKFIGNKIEVREKYENKKIFKEILAEIGIEAIPGENIPIEDLDKVKFEHYQEKFGKKKLVLQIAEATWGGGSGTFFIEDADELSFFYDRVAQLRKTLKGKSKKIETVNIAPFIEGTSASISCCATRHGTLTGSIQTQAIDIEGVGAKLQGRSGVFAGHDWSFKNYSEESTNQAIKIARSFGEYLYKNGYKGIFGLDLLVEESGKVWPVECNPRETDAFPLICMLQMQSGVPPMQIFHNLEHLNIPYEINFEEIDENYKKKYSASQILLYNKTDQYLIDRAVLEAGVYKIEDGNLIFKRPGFAIWDLEDEDEFLLTEDISKVPGNIYDPHERMLRLIKKGRMLDLKGNLKPEVVEVVEKIYKKLKLVPIEYGLREKDGLKILFTKKLKEAKESADLAKADMVNVVRKARGGVGRPLEIVWRKKIDNRPIIGQIRSKRAKKQINSDIKKLNELGIEIRVVDEINKDIFDRWLALYRKIIGAKEKGHLIIDEDWFVKKLEKGKKVGAVAAYKDKVLLGGELFFEVNGILSIGYGLAERVEGLAGSLTLLLDYNFMKYAQEKGYEEISFGQDDNLYGYDLSCGLILYKAKLGFAPYPAKKTYWTTTYFRNFAKFDDPVMLFSGDFNKIRSLTVITNNTNQDFQAYLPVGLSEIKVLNRQVILTQQSRLPL